jgi:MSHA biogenesis protein MshN
MSLINKMLQDLDARGTAATESFPSQIRPVANERRGLATRIGPKTVAAIAAGALAGLALAWFARAQYQHARSAGKPAAAAVTPLKPTPAAARPEQGMSGTITMGPANAPAPMPPAPVAAPAQPKSVAPFAPDSEKARRARQAIMAELQTRTTAGGSKQEAKHQAKQESQREAQHETKHEAKNPTEKQERRVRKAVAPAVASTAASAGGGKAADATAATGKRGIQGRQDAGSQRAEGEYRRALDSLQDGRMTEAIAALEQALKLDPGHDAARQTLVGLLIETKRLDEAMRHLQAGLALDVRQPALAMLLARLQIERGGSGIETLTRTLPYAGNHADYHAFLAGALEREQRHREAAEQYQAALRAAPGNAVWWMGLGMALQADKRNAEALEAFQRARASGTLSPELQAFVDRRLQQLGR